MAETKGLSEREQEILALVANGASNKDIARELVISINTVKVHLRNIYGKLGISSRSAATLYAVREGIVSPNGENGNSYLENKEYIPGEGGSIRGFLHLLWSKPKQRMVILVSLIIVLGLLGFGFIWGWKIIAENRANANREQVSNVEVELNRWHELAEMITPRDGLAAVSYENKIYAIGGEASDGVIGITEVFDPETNEWSRVANKPIPVSEISAAIVGGKIYVPGGKQKDGIPTNIMEVYYPQENIWKTSSPLPIPLSAYALVSFEGRLLVFGGWDGEKYRNDVYEYNPSLDRWTKRTSMPHPRGYHGAAVVNGKVYVVGGYDGDAYLADTDIYSPDAELRDEDPWKTAEMMPQPRAKFGVLSIADVIYVFGGEGMGGDMLPPLRYFPQDNSWKEFKAPDESYSEKFGLALLGTNIYLIGGMDQANKLSSMVSSYEAVYVVRVPIYVRDGGQ
ncbi:MAG TPA: hypothetical protein G4N95_09310 [Anaerolineae bacterium]|nr:hypothetical protein [Anaerolineae bacterium]